MAEANGVEKTSGTPGTPQETSEPAQDPAKSHKYSFIRLDISNSVLPLDKLSVTPSSKDGLSPEIETQIRSLGCELIQLAGKLLKLPQVCSLSISNSRNCKIL